MKKTCTLFLLFILTGVGGTEALMAQYGYGNRYGRQRSAVPQAQDNPKPPEPMTAEELVDERMPAITEALELNPFEEAIVQTTLVKYVQQRIELRILELEPNRMKEEMVKIGKNQEADLRAGLPEDKFNTYMELQENKFNTKKMKKKKKRKSRYE